jgi:hypothetical protein
MAGRKSITDWQRYFWARVDKRGADECWPWKGHAGTNGYGVAFDYDQDWKLIRTGAHRVSNWLATGELPPVVMHVCDNPGCVNPKHLRSGTHRDNMLDCSDKRRFPAQSVTHCRRGHEYTPENTIVYRRKNGRTARGCRACRPIHKRAFKERHRKPSGLIWKAQCRACGRFYREIGSGDSFCPKHRPEAA